MLCDRVAANLDSLKYSGNSLNLENSGSLGNFVQFYGKIGTNKIAFIRRIFWGEKNAPKYVTFAVGALPRTLLGKLIVLSQIIIITVTFCFRDNLLKSKFMTVGKSRKLLKIASLVSFLFLLALALAFL